MILRTPLAASLLLAFGLIAFAPTGSATCLDTTPDDDGVGSDGCNVPVLGECNVHVLAYGQLPGSGGSCDSFVQCVRECGPPTADASFAGPCSYDLNPTDDNGVAAKCTVAGITCTVGALRYGSADPVQFPRCQGPIYCVTDPCHYPYPIQ